MTSPVDFISGPRMVSTPGKRTNGKTGVLTKHARDFEILRQPLIREAAADHDSRCDLRQWHAGRLGQIRDRARRARVDLEHVDRVVLDRELRVHQADDFQRARDAPRVIANLRDVARRDEIRRHDAGAVARVNAGLLDVLHDAADDDGAGRVSDCIDVELEGVFEELVDEDGMPRRRGDGVGHVAIQRRRVVDDRHAAAAKHVRRPDDEREADLG